MKDYLYDGTFDGLLTALFYGYQEKEETRLFNINDYSPSLLATQKEILTEVDKADRVYNSIISKLSTETLNNIYCLYLSETQDSHTLALRYLKLCYHFGDSINLAKNNEIVGKVDRLVKQVHFEAHRFKGFVRFKEIAPLLFYAKIAPDFNILPLLMDHFKTRFSDQNFMIHDTKRNSMIVYNKQDIFIQYLTKEESATLLSTSQSDPFEALFKSYYRATTIEERVNARRRNAYMPRRYFKNLVEL